MIPRMALITIVALATCRSAYAQTTGNGVVVLAPECTRTQCLNARVGISFG